MMGFDEDLNKAMVNATRETVDFLSKQKMVPLDRYEAYSVASMAADCRVTQVVDIRKGVHCMVPKFIFEAAAAPPPPRPRAPAKPPVKK
jgi:acetamidase/formamidase